LNAALCSEEINQEAAQGGIPSAGLRGAVILVGQLWEHLCLRLLLTKKSRLPDA
jgi:hypothetical protein